jgi:hypothetical protein
MGPPIKALAACTSLQTESTGRFSPLASDSRFDSVPEYDLLHRQRITRDVSFVPNVVARGIQGRVSCENLMHTAHAIHDAWQPQTKQDRDAVLSELEAILASPHFCNSKRYPALLHFIVTNALAGRTDLLKERTLGVEVFDRPPDYDTNADTVVRYTAGEVRKRLLLYYSEQDSAPSVRISLPAGSYVPEFTHLGAVTDAASHSTAGAEPGRWAHGGPGNQESQGNAPQVGAGEMPHAAATLATHSPHLGRRLWPAVIAVLLLALAAGIWWRYGAGLTPNQMDAFWAPVIRGQHSLIVCTGSSVFDNTNTYSGVATANKDIDYPFVSWQSVTAAVQISSLLSRQGINTQLASAPSMPITDLREHSVTLLGAYNNQWTMRLQGPLRYYFLPGNDEVIVDRLHPQTQWKRDLSLPYSSADDYAIVARFRDPTIDGWVVVLAGVGRNGTEAAAQFVTNPHYLELLRQRLGADLSSANLEAVLKVNVIEGKTGAPALLAVYSW